MEVRQRTELTGTNRSCGLTTYFSREASWQQFESHREKVKTSAIAQLIETMLVIVSENTSRTIALARASSGFALRQFFPGGYTEEVTPVPIPNTEVKLFRANGTAGASLWESRTLPGF